MSVEKKINYDVQGGIRNYLGKQKTISNVPLKWKSGPGHPKTELAYITKEEKDLLIKKDADVNAQNYNLTSVLMYAKSNSLISNSFKIIEKLIENGANIYLKDIYGKNVIDWVKNENKELYEYFKTK